MRNGPERTGVTVGARVMGRTSRRGRAQATQLSAAMAAVAVVLTVGCATSSNTSEVTGAIGWGTLADQSGQQARAGTAAGAVPEPQVMAEVTLPDGGVPTVPQPAVPQAPPVTVASAVAAEPTPPVLAAPSAPGGTTPSSIRLPDVVPGGARALERLDSDAQRTVASQALGRIRFDWRTNLPGWQIRFLPGRAGLRGSTFPDQQVIEVYVRNGDRPDGLSHVIAHEMGHAIDVSRMGTPQHDAWKAARGISPDVVWFPGASGATDYATGAGDWAESFAWWQTGVGWYSRLGRPPDALQTAALIRLAGLG